MRGRAALLLVLPLLYAAAPATAATPASNAVLSNGTTVDGRCSNEPGVDSEAHGWIVFTVDPRRVHGGPNGGVELAPQVLPRYEAFAPEDLVTTFYGPAMQGIALPTTEGCRLVPYADGPDGSDARGFSLVLRRAGPYVFQQYDASSHWVLVPDTSPDPHSVACAGNDPHHPASDAPPPAGVPPSGAHWFPDSFCNKTTLTQFSVKADKGECPVVGDMSQWPLVPYISQYDAGARLDLPTSYGQEGGNACGPSSLLMALLRVRRNQTGSDTPSLPSLETVFDATMNKTRAEVAPDGKNLFVGNPNGVAYLKSIGFKEARTFGLDADYLSLAGVNLTKIASALQNGPVVVSTAFGSGRWGITGGGHMIVINGVSETGKNFRVSDPAGNFFDSSRNHYGPAECGYDVLYPVQWVLAYTAGRWALEFGEHSRPPASALRSGRTAQLGSAISIEEAHPGAADAPSTFYLRDSEGRRAGWIDGNAVEEIPGAAVAKTPPGWTDPSSGDPAVDTGPPVDPPPSPRAIVVPDPAAGTTLHVESDGAYALKAGAWVDGDVTATDALTGSGSGAVASPALDSIAAAPATTVPVTTTPVPTATAAPTPAGQPASVPSTGRLTAAKARVRKRAVRVKLTCTGGPCRAAATLSTRRRGRAVVIAKGSATLAAGARSTLKLKPTRAGRRLLAKHRRITATLKVLQRTPGRPAAVLRRQSLRL